MLPIYNVSLKNIFEDHKGVLRQGKELIYFYYIYKQKKPHRISRTNIVVCHQEMARLMMEQ